MELVSDHLKKREELDVQVQGNLYQVTNLQSFVASYAIDAQNPDAKSYIPFGNLLVHMAFAFPLPFNNGFLPSVSVKTKADHKGAFTLNIPAAIPGTTDAYLIVYREVGKVMGVPILGPLYRSATFKVKDLTAEGRKIYLMPQEATLEQGITQAEISKEVKAAAKAMNEVESLSAWIGANGVNVTAKGKGATIKFDILLSPSTAHDLNELIKHKVDDLDIDLPGWDLITGLCVNESEIEGQIRTGVKNMVTQFNARIKDEIVKAVAAEAGINEALVRTFMEAQTSLTFEKVRYPVVKEQKVGPVTVKTRSILLDPCFGFPRNLF